MKNRNYINSAEDTLWLSAESTELLKQAAKWPTAMMKVVHTCGVLSSFLSIFAFNQANYILVASATIGLTRCFYKGVEYSSDIRLIRNELIRRNS